SYKVIAGTSSLLRQLEENVDDETDQIIAENLYLRSLMYFYLTNVFGRPYDQNPESSLSVPLKLAEYPFVYLPRATVAEVYDQIETVLLKSLTLFMEFKSNIYDSQYAAEALLARVHLYMGDNEKAIEYANKVIDSGKFSLLTAANYKQLATAAPENNSEVIFAIKFVKDVDYSDNGWYTIGSMYASIDGAGWGEMYASRSYLEQHRYYPEDARQQIAESVVTDDSELHAYYVTDDYKYQSVKVTQQGDDYVYSENGANKNLIKESNGAGSYVYFLEKDGKKRTALIDKKLDNRNG